MKTIGAFYWARNLILTFALILSTAAEGAELITQWNFNLADPTNNVAVGTTEPSFGAGTASLLTGTTATFASGNGSSDPVSVDDSGWNTAQYPTQGNGNKTRGVQFRVSTVGFERITVTWDHRHSSTASRYLRFQYSSDGSNFVDGPVFAATAQDTFFPRLADLGSFPAVNNNSNFVFRIVSEFESTAIGNETNQYIATGTGQTYSTGGTWRFDMVTVSGEIFSGNAFPTISSISNQTTRVNTLTPEIPFTVGDVESAPEALDVTASSGNLVLVPNENIFLMGSGANRTVQIFPAFDQSGTAVITLRVRDEADKFTTTSFTLTVTPDNTAPTISVFTNYHTVINTPFAPIAFTIGDAESAAADLTLSAASSNPTVIPGASLVFGGTGTNRTLTITPATEQSGNSVITVTVSDGTFTASRAFSVMVVPSPSVLLCESFTYADGPVNANSGFRWTHHSGIAGQTQVTLEELRLSSASTEDINAVLINSPYYPSNSGALYVGFSVNFSGLPSGVGEYFAHFREIGGAFRARVYATTTNVTSGSFRLGIANNAGSVVNATIFPLDLNPQTEYVVVVRYDVPTGISTLWVNPTSEADTSAVASDTPAIAAIGSWAFRQSGTQTGSMGALAVDDLKVGLSFGDVVPGYRLRIERSGGSVMISWLATATDEGYLLETTTDLTSGNWQPATETRVRSGSRDQITIAAPANNAFYRLVK